MPTRANQAEENKMAKKSKKPLKKAKKLQPTKPLSVGVQNPYARKTHGI